MIVGSMFSGKSEELIRRVKRAVIARRAVQVFKPAIDVRFNSELVRSHDGDSFEARPVLVGEEILQLMSPDTTVVGIEGYAERRRVRLAAPVPLVAEVTVAAIEELDLRPGTELWASVKAMILMRSTRMPERRATVSPPPMAMILRPRLVYFWIT